MTVSGDLDAQFRRVLGGAQRRPPLRVGIEHEYYVDFKGEPRDFRRVIHRLGVPGERLDPGDHYAYRLTSGLSLTCDEAEAEIATPPVPVTAGFTRQLRSWTEQGAWTLRRLLPPAVAIKGASTHFSVSAPDELQEAACLYYARAFAPVLMLLAESPQSHGIMVRPRPGRIELCTEFVAGERLELVSAFAAGSVVECLRVAAGGAQRVAPLAVELEPSNERVGIQIRRGAFGADLYARGRSAVLETVDGVPTLASERLAQAWAAARPHVRESLRRATLRALDRLVSADGPIQPELPDPTPTPARLSPSPFGEAIAPQRRGDVAIRATVTTWAFTVFRLERGGVERFACVPSEHLGRFLAALRGPELPRLLGRLLSEPPLGRTLECHCQVSRPGFWDALESPASLLAPERGAGEQIVDGDNAGDSVRGGTSAGSATKVPRTGGGRPGGGGQPEQPGGTHQPPPPQSPPPPVVPPPGGGTPPGGPRTSKPPGIFVEPRTHLHEPAAGTTSIPMPIGPALWRRYWWILPALLVVALGLTASFALGRGGDEPLGASDPGSVASPSPTSTNEPPPGSAPSPAGGSVPSPVSGGEPTVTLTPPAALTPPPVILSGNRSTTFSVLANPGSHPCGVGPTLEVRFFITRDRSVEPNPVAITVTGPGLPQMTGTTVIGPGFDSNGGAATASGVGAYCGFTTTWAMSITISPVGVTGTLTIGGDGVLPGGQAITFSFIGGPPH